MNKILLLVGLLSIVSCKNKLAVDPLIHEYSVSLKEYVDPVRQRLIPVAIYEPADQKTTPKIPVIFSHGYGVNKGDDYLVDYTYLLERLAAGGYFVVSIQHELKTDTLLAMEEPFKTTRMANWERGAENIGFVVDQIRKDFPFLNFPKLALIGHSNGGDMSVLFAHQHPELLSKLISLDNRRMDLPRVSKPKIYTLRSKDCPADEGVLPTYKEQKKYGITVKFTSIDHGNMDNDATENERKYLTTEILKYLNEK